MYLFTRYAAVKLMPSCMHRMNRYENFQRTFWISYSFRGDFVAFSYPNSTARFHQSLFLSLGPCVTY
jgi:hypothetical protein